MKPCQNQKYLTIATYTAIVLLSTVSIIFLFLKLDIVLAFFKKLFAIFAPLLYGACIAYALNPLMKFYEEKIDRKSVV